MKGKIYRNFPFGKFKGQKISCIDTKYLVHALEEFTLPEDLQTCLRYEVAKRLSIPAYVLDTDIGDTVKVAEVDFIFSDGASLKNVTHTILDDLETICEICIQDKDWDNYVIHRKDI